MTTGGAERAPPTTLYDALGSLTEGQIRLLVIKPGSSPQAIECELIATSLDHSYEALSYTRALATVQARDSPNEDEWESDEGEIDDDLVEHLEELEVTGESHIEINNIQVNVVPTLLRALQHLRKSSEARTIWVDELCINLSDVRDRNVQVAHMDKIYSRAECVIAWLGLEGASCAEATGELLGLAANVHLTALALTAERIRPLAALLQRPWFRRGWVVPEVVLGREVVVQIGARTVPWEWFLRAARVYRDHMVCCKPAIDPEQGRVFAALRDSLAHVLALDTEALRGLTLRTALQLSRGREVTDPRDKVYSQLALLPAARRLVTVDYANTAEELYEEVAVRTILHTGDLAILTDANAYGGDVACATWAPDWTADAAVPGVDLYEHFSAAGRLTADVARCAPHTIKVAGLIVDNISDVIDTEDPDERDPLMAVHTMLKACEDRVAQPVTGPCPYATGSERLAAFWTTMLRGVSIDGSRRTQPGDRAAYDRWRTWLVLYARSRDRQSLRQHAAGDPMLAAHTAALLAHANEQRFFCTEDGYFGVGPDDTEADDVVCVLAGARVPLVLRAIDEHCEVCDNGQSCYQLIGPAYMHGVMDGEAVRGIEQDQEDPIKLCIR